MLSSKVCEKLGYACGGCDTPDLTRQITTKTSAAAAERWEMGGRCGYTHAHAHMYDETLNREGEKATKQADRLLLNKNDDEMMLSSKSSLLRLVHDNENSTTKQHPQKQNQQQNNDKKLSGGCDDTHAKCDKNIPVCAQLLYITAQNRREREGGAQSPASTFHLTSSAITSRRIKKLKPFHNTTACICCAVTRTVID